MTQETQSQTECKTDPASQPPVATLPDDDNCKSLDIGRTAPDRCSKPKCNPCCGCPPVPSDKPPCLDKLIKDEADAINKGEQAKKFKADLEALLGKVKAATLEYTADAYKDLMSRWRTEDEAIVCLIRSIQCALPCWWCVIECEICPLINDIRGLELELSGEYLLAGETPPAPGTKPPCVKSIYELRFWWWREKMRRQALFDHVANVMKAWETPFKTIDGILKANGEIIKTITGALNIDQKKEAAKYLFDLVRLVRQHMAIAPVADTTENTTKIERTYVELCCCDKSPELHKCCGVVIRLPTVLDRVIGALPYLIKPELYPELVCCLATKVYQPSKKSAVEADSRYSELDTEVKNSEAAIAAQIGSLPADAKIRLAKTIDCKDYQPKGGGDGAKPKCCDGAEAEPPSGTNTPQQQPCTGAQPSAGTSTPQQQPCTGTQPSAGTSTSQQQPGTGTQPSPCGDTQPPPCNDTQPPACGHNHSPANCGGQQATDSRDQGGDATQSGACKPAMNAI